jgi:hypothetical protein
MNIQKSSAPIKQAAAPVKPSTPAALAKQAAAPVKHATPAPAK